MKPIFSVTNKMLNLIVEITQKVTVLEFAQGRDLHLRKTNRLRSIHSSLAIEQNSLSLEQVTDVIEGKRILGDPKEIKEVRNAYEVYELVFKMNPYSIPDFLEAHRLMTQDLINESGSFRLGDVGVYDSSGHVVHVGARPQFINELVTELFDWAKQDNTPDLIKSCAVHFEIEMIHPFADGNGRMGRVWQNLILSKWQQVFEWIPIETIVYANQQKYYDMLSIGNKKNDATPFIEFMLEVILEMVSQFSIEQDYERVSHILSDATRENLNTKELTFFENIYPYLLEQGEIGNSKAVQISGRPSETVRRYLLKFVELGVLTTIGENKNRKYLLADSKDDEK